MPPKEQRLLGSPDRGSHPSTTTILGPNTPLISISNATSKKVVELTSKVAAELS